MRKTLLFLLLLSIYLTGYSQVQIGSNTSNASGNFPFRINQNFSYSQTLYLASEINASGTITSIQWYYNGESDLPNSQNLDVYLGTTTKTEFATDFDWVPGGNLTKVYTGGISTGSAPGWVTITLATPFVYNGTDNLVVAVDDNMTGRDSGTGFYATDVTGKRSIGFYSTSVDLDPQSPPVDGYTKATMNAVPNIIFGGIAQTCTTPVNISVTDITSTGASVIWSDSATHTEGSQYYISTTDTPPTASTSETGSVSTIKSIDIAGLSPITTYYLWVRNVCGSGTYSAWSEMSSFLSGCATYSTFFENFDTTVSNTMPYCWSSIIRGTESLTSTQVRTYPSSSQAYSLPNVLLMTNGTATGTYDVIAVSPEMTTLSTGNYRLKFYAKYGGSGITSGAIEIGTLDNNTETAVFTPIPGLSVNLTDTYVEYTVPLAYTGTDMYVGIRHASTASRTSIYIDDIKYELAPNCPDVSNIAVSSVTESGVTVTWEDGGVESQWDIAIGEEAVVDPSTLTFDTTSNTDHSFTKATGLSPATNYNVWVRSHCPNDDRGVWIGPVSFTTLCTSATAISENFDAIITPELPVCWSKILRGTASGALVETSGSSSNSAANSVRLFNQNSSGNDYDVILVSPPLSNLGDNTHRLRFTVRGTGSPQLQIGTLDSNLDVATFSALAMQDPLSVTDSYVEYVIDFSAYSGGTDPFIGFKLVSPNSYKTIYIDDVFWEEKPACADVENISVAAVGTTTAAFNWDVQGTESLWDVVVGLAETTEPNTLTPITTDAYVNAIEVTSLQPGTAYKVWVRSHCVAGNGAWIGPVDFNTACVSVESFTHDFTGSTSSQNLPACYNKLIRNATSGSFIAVGSQGITAFADYSNTDADVILVCPMVSTLNNVNYRLTLNVAGSNDIEVGTLNNLSPTATFTKITQFTPSGGSSTEHVVDLSSYSGTDQYIGLRIKTVNPGSSQVFSLKSISWEIDGTLGIDEYSLSNLAYFPNPVEDVLNISFDNVIDTVSIYNVLGQRVLSNSVNASAATINLSMLNSGTYFVKIVFGNQTKTVKILKD